MFRRKDAATPAARKLKNAAAIGGRIDRREARALEFEERDAPHRPPWYGSYPEHEAVQARRRAKRQRRRERRGLTDKQFALVKRKAPSLLERLGLK